ncbi:MAG: hypothetical protein ACRYG7_14230 [Janthinobacterium lividum]
MVHGYHRRDVAKMRRLRLVLTEIRNCMRSEEDIVKPEEVITLPGDEVTAAVPEMSDEEYRAAFAAVAELDNDIIL